MIDTLIIYKIADACINKLIDSVITASKPLFEIYPRDKLIADLEFILQCDYDGGTRSIYVSQSTLSFSILTNRVMVRSGLHISYYLTLCDMVAAYTNEVHTTTGYISGVKLLKFTGRGLGGAPGVSIKMYD